MRHLSLTLVCLLLVLPGRGQGRLNEFYADLRQSHNSADELRACFKAKQQYGDLPEIASQIGRAYGDSGLHEAAIPYLLQGCKADADWVKGWSLYYLGKAYFVTEQPAKAKEAFAQCIALNATSNVVKAARRDQALTGMSPDFDSFVLKETKHLRFHFHPAALDSVSDIPAYMQAREDALEAIGKFLGFAVKRKINFFVWPDSKTGYRVFDVPLGFSKPEFYVTHSSFNQTTGHELAHIVSHHAMLPVRKTQLINEGLAVYLDQRRVPTRMAVARRAVRGSPDHLDVRLYWQTKLPPDAYGYPVAGAFVEMLQQKGGKDPFMKLLANQTYEYAQQLYGAQLQEWINGFEAELMKD